MSDEQQFIVCEDCEGKGKKNENFCQTCLGLGVWIIFNSKNIFFDRETSRSNSQLLKIKRFFKNTFRLLLIIFGLLGLASLFQAIFLSAFLAQTHLFFAQSRNFLMFIFWLSLLTDLYLFYSKKGDNELKDLYFSFSKKDKINVNDFLSISAEKAISYAIFLAQKLKQGQIEPIHLFLGILQQNEGAMVISRLGITWSAIKEKISKILDGLNSNYLKNKIIFSSISKKIIIESFLQAYQKKKKAVFCSEILSSLVSGSEPIKLMFDDFEIKPDDVKNVIIWKEVYQNIRQDWSNLIRGAAMKGRGIMNVAMTAVATPFLDNFSQDLTQLAKKGFLAPCMDREKEMSEIFRMLEGGRKNLVLVGPPGVGKTTIIEGLARKMIAEEVPKVISDKRLVSLSLSRLVAGANASGEIEQRLQIIMNEIVRAGNIILFIKDIHNLVGVKTGSGELDASSILADALRKKYFLVLSTSINGDYEKYLENNPLGQTLFKVKIEEPEKNEAILILESKTSVIESKNQTYFSYQSLSEIIELSQKYLHDRFLPDKAIALLEEVAVYVRSKRGKNSFILKEDVAELVAKKTGIPQEKISQTEAEALMDLETKIHERIIDQNEAVKTVAEAIKRARTELRDPKKPIVNLLFLGPTGVGKTELAKTVADLYFGSEQKMIRLDMSEFQTQETVGRLIGSQVEPHGVLTEAVRKNPFTLLLLDEIEKSHPDILNVFLQVMDDGRLTDWTGKTIDFTNLIIIGTSNAASDWVQEQLRGGKKIQEFQETLVKEKLTPYFRPEFLNRFDAVIVFKPLSLDDLKEITKLLIKSLSKLLEKKGIFLEATEGAIEELTQEGYDPVFGARPLKRLVQEKINNALANFLLSGKISRRDLVILERGGKIRIEKGK